MLKKYRVYIILLLVCFAALIVVQYNIPQPLDWSPTFSRKDNAPYGTKALFELLPDVFKEKNISIANKPIYNLLAEENQETKNNYSAPSYSPEGGEHTPAESPLRGAGGLNYIFLTYDFNPDKLDVKYLLDFVQHGNNVFVASAYFRGKFADTLKLKQQYDYFFPHTMTTDSDTVAVTYQYFQTDTVEINYAHKKYKAVKNYSFPKAVDNIFFSSFDTTKTSIIGVNAQDEPNFIRMKYGNGNFFLSTLPHVFSNYCFTDEKNSEYVYKALSFLPIADVIWDEYYKYGNNKKESPLIFIFNNPPLTAAYYLLFAGLFLFIIFGGKRKQRIIPVIEPLKNTTLEFVDIVGNLYFQQGDYKNIADKKINYFLDGIRTRFQIKTNIFDDVFVKKVSALSGIDEEKISTLFKEITYISNRAVITQTELLKVNSVIEDFHKNTKR